MAEQGQSTCHIALGQVHAHQAEESVGLREESKTEQAKIVREDRRQSPEISKKCLQFTYKSVILIVNNINLIVFIVYCVDYKPTFVIYVTRLYNLNL